MTDKPPPVEVIISNFSDAAPFVNRDKKSKDRHSTFRTFILAPGVPVLVLAHMPNRKKATITVVGQSTDVGYLCGAQGDAQSIANSPAPSTQNEPGAIFMAAQVLTIEGTDEVWAVSNGTTFGLGVQIVFEEK